MYSVSLNCTRDSRHPSTSSISDQTDGAINCKNWCHRQGQDAYCRPPGLPPLDGYNRPNCQTAVSYLPRPAGPLALCRTGWTLRVSDPATAPMDYGRKPDQRSICNQSVAATAGGCSPVSWAHSSAAGSGIGISNISRSGRPSCSYSSRPNASK